MTPTTSAAGVPSVDRVLKHPLVEHLEAELGHALVLDAVRRTLDVARQRALAGGSVPPDDELARMVASHAREAIRQLPTPVVNATGVILHTNLGRAPVSAATAAAMEGAMHSYTALEMDLESGERGSRQAAVREIAISLTGAEDAFVVNNNAGGTLLVLSALAAGHEVLVSRGELVEIGGGFRLPEVFAAGGARLLEVGTTNRTYSTDYDRALEQLPAPPPQDRSGRGPFILRVHASNYRISGFHHRPTLAELVEVARRRGVPLVDDLGSGTLLDTTEFGLSPEPRVQDSLAEGADLVTFSGDKLLGGPQAGIIVGRADLVETLRRHPLARALRPGKDVFAGLSATLSHYARGQAAREVPVWRMIAAHPDELAVRARGWGDALAAECSDRSGAWTLQLKDGFSTVGGGSVPGSELPTTVLCVSCAEPAEFAARLRRGPHHVVARIERNHVLLDPRTVLPGQDGLVVSALRDALGALST